MDDLNRLMLRLLKDGLLLRGRGIAKVGSRQYGVILPIEYNEQWEYLRSRGYRLTVILILEEATN